MSTSKSAANHAYTDLPPSSANSSFHTPNAKMDLNTGNNDQAIACDVGDDAASVSLPTRSRSSSSTSSSDDTASVVHDAVDDVYGRVSAELLENSFEEHVVAKMQQLQAEADKTLSPYTPASPLSTSMKSVATLTAGDTPTLPTLPETTQQSCGVAVNNSSSTTSYCGSNNNTIVHNKTPEADKSKSPIGAQVTSEAIITSSTGKFEDGNNNNNSQLMSVLLAELRSLRADNERLNQQVSDLARNKSDQQSAVNNLAMAIISNIASSQQSSNNAASTWSKSNAMIDAESQASSSEDQAPSPVPPTTAVQQLSAARHLMTLPTACQRSFNQIPTATASATDLTLATKHQVACSSCTETKRVMSELVHAVNTVRLELEELKLSQRRMLDCLKTTAFLAPQLPPPNTYPAIESGDKVSGKPPISTAPQPEAPKPYAFSTRYKSSTPPPVSKQSEIPRLESPAPKIAPSSSYLSGLNGGNSTRLSTSYLNGLGSTTSVNGAGQKSSSPPVATTIATTTAPVSTSAFYSTRTSTTTSIPQVPPSKSSSYSSIGAAATSFSPPKAVPQPTTRPEISPLKSSTPNPKSSYLPESGSANSSWRLCISGSASSSNAMRASYSAEQVIEKRETPNTSGIPIASPSPRKVTFQDFRSGQMAPTDPSSVMEVEPIAPPAGFSSSSTRDVMSNSEASGYYANFTPQPPPSPAKKSGYNGPEAKSERQAVDEIILKYLGNRNPSQIPTAANSNVQPADSGSENYYTRRSPSPHGIMKQSRGEPQFASPSAVHRKLFAPSSSVDGLLSQMKGEY